MRMELAAKSMISIAFIVSCTRCSVVILEALRLHTVLISTFCLCVNYEHMLCTLHVRRNEVHRDTYTEAMIS